MTGPIDAESWLDPIFDAVVSDVQASGYFDVVNEHEPKRKPGTRLSAAVWLQSIRPVALASGLASTSAQIVFIVRLYGHTFKANPDRMERNLMKAASNLMRRYHDDFDFAGAIRNVDLLGQFGLPLHCIGGYLEQDNAQFRLIDVYVPCIVNDVWPQVS